MSNASSQGKADSQAKLCEALAAARLNYQVSELESRVAWQNRSPRKSTPYIKCVIDATVLTEALDLVKGWHVESIVPLEALSQLDRLKKGAEQVNANAREAIRFLERCQTRKPKRENGIRIQSELERFSTWTECEKYFQKEGASSINQEKLNTEQPEPSSFEDTPRYIRGSLMLFLFLQEHIHHSETIKLVTNDPELSQWASRFSITTVTANDMDAIQAQQNFRRRERRTSKSKSPTIPPATLVSRNDDTGFCRGPSRGRGTRSLWTET